MSKRKKRFPWKFPLIVLGLLLAVSIGIVMIQSQTPRSNRITPNETLSPVFSQLPAWLDDATWSTPTPQTETTVLGTKEGQITTASILRDEASVAHFENESYLSSLGYTPDPQLAADGPGSSQWGYSNHEGDIIIFSYITTPSETPPNQPVEFNCPCTIAVSVFVSSPTTSANPSVSLANPASENCVKNGGSLTIEKNGSGGEYGLCNFTDNMSCEEWALYRGDCPVGGVKTTGYDNIQQKYCAWLGGETLAEPNATCTLPSGNTCPVTSLYNGTCS